MSYTYANRRRTGETAPHKNTAARQQPSLDALRSGAAKATREQLGHRVDLPDTMRSKMESAFGADLSAVKLYESEAVGEAGANAVAQGNTIAFAPGMLDFTSFGGQALLGHEISHVVSQARGEVAGSGFLNDHALEARADREGAMAAAGQQIAAPTAALSGVSAAPAAAPMQASKKEDKENRKFGKLVGKKDKEVKNMVESYDSTQAEMLKAMKEQGFTDEQIEAQMMFQRVNSSKGLLDRYQTAQGAVIEGSHVTDEHAKDKKSFKFGRGVFTKKGVAKRAARENHLINDILVGDQEVRQAEQMAYGLTPQGKIEKSMSKLESGSYDSKAMAKNITALTPRMQQEISAKSQTLSKDDGNRFFFMRGGATGDKTGRSEYFQQMKKAGRKTNLQMMGEMSQGLDLLPESEGSSYKDMAGRPEEAANLSAYQDRALSMTQKYLDTLSGDDDAMDALRQSSAMYSQLGTYSEENKKGLVGGQLEADHRAMNDMILRSFGPDTLAGRGGMGLSESDHKKMGFTSQAMAAMQPAVLAAVMNPDKMKDLSPQEQQMAVMYQQFFEKLHAK